MNLGDYLAWALRQSWKWGKWDCSRFAAEWCIRRGRADPMDFLKPLYTSEFQALRTIREGGGLVALWSRGMEDIGAPVVDEAQAGDVSIVEELTDSGTAEVCAISAGPRFAMLGLRGLVFVPATPIIVWRP